MAMSEEKRRQQSEKMKARWAEKRAQNKQPEKEKDEQNFSIPLSEEAQAPVTPPATVTIGVDEYQAILDQIEEIKRIPWQLFGKQQQEASASGGKITGTYEKYRTEPALYPDPTERLAAEKRLERFAFPINYELQYTISDTSYTSIDGIRTKEPKFELELIRIMMNEETGEPTDGRYSICKLILHEDPDTALILARENGVPIDEENELAFLNEMRYIRMRNWLLDCFYPPKLENKQARKDTVIEGRLVQYWEVSGEDRAARKIDFSKLPKFRV